MSREAHVRFWEHVGVRVPRVTRLMFGILALTVEQLMRLLA
jgi:hypothetical protein